MQNRRELLIRSAALSALLLAPTSKAQTPTQPAFNRAAFDAASMDDVLRTLGITKPVESREVRLEAPEIAELGTTLNVGFGCTVAGAKRLLLLADRQIGALAAAIDVSDAVEPGFVLPLHLGQTANLYAVVLTGDNKVFFAQREVKLALPLHASHASATRPQAAVPARPFKPAPMQIRAQLKSGQAQVRLRINHPMESGWRTDAQGRNIAAHYITELGASLNGVTAWTAQLGPLIAKDPQLQFMLKNAKAGDKLAITWLDSKGEKRSDEISLS